MFNFFLRKTDSQIQLDVMTELKWDPSVTSTLIQVTSLDGMVTLEGSVPRFPEKIRAEQAARRVSGVLAVADEITVEMYVQ